MFRKILKAMFFMALIGGFLLITAYFGSRAYFTEVARDKANGIIAQSLEDSEPDNQTQELITITRAVYERFKPDEPSNHWVLRLRSLATNKALPSFLRYQDGVIETLVETGLCDNAARYLQFVLAQRGYKSVQWNMITNSRAHSILLVYLDGERTAILDPMFGIIGYDGASETFLPPFEIRDRMKNGTSFEEVFLTLDDQSDTEFYEDFASVRMAALGQPLNIEADLPMVSGDTVFLGEINGDDKDVYNAAAANGMSPFWHYAGHKYDRSWIRMLNIHQDITLEFILVSNVEDSVITSDIAPVIDGKIMRWDLNEGDVIKFYDGRAKRSFERMNSYINIDQIAISPR